MFPPSWWDGGNHGSGTVADIADSLHPDLQAEDGGRQAWTFVTSEPNPSDILPPTRPYSLWAYGAHFIQTITAFQIAFFKLFFK